MARRIIVLLLLAALTLFLAAAPAAAQQPKRGGVVRIAEREAPSLDPHLSISFLTHSHMNLVYSQLVRFPSGPEQKHPTDFSILPDLAERWEQKTPTTLVFHLRRGVKFHNKPPVNGREVTAEDVKYSLERFMAKSGFRARFEPVQAIDAVDRYTVRITLKEPFAAFLNHLANPTYTPILAREAEEKFKDFNHPDAVIGTGPFVLKSYERGVRLVFERNPDYFVKGLPYLDGAVIEITPDAAARLSLLRAGKVEFGHMWGYASPEEGKSLQKTNPELSITPTQVMAQGMIYFRTDQPPFNDVRVRRAVSLAIDRKAWNDALLFGEGCTDTGPLPCAMKEWKLEAARMDPARAKYLVGYDPAEAKKLLAEAGHPRGFATRPGRRQPVQDRHQRRAQAGRVRQVHLHHVPGEVREDGDRPDHAVHRGRRLPLRSVLPRAARQPESRRRCRARQAARGPAAGAGPEAAQGDRRGDPALRGRQGLLRVPADAAPVHQSPTLRERLQAPRRLRSGAAAHVYLARPVSRLDVSRRALSRRGDRVPAG